MKNEHLWVAVIAGGQGTRLFPISHPKKPKQFCELDKDNTFIQAVCENFKSLGVRPQNIVIIVTNDEQYILAKRQTLLRGVLSQNIAKVDPSFGYAGSMVYASKFIRALDPDAIVINTPADQFVDPDENFYVAIEDAVTAAEDGNAVIVGVKINDIVTAMGCGHAIYDDSTGGPCFELTGERFVEKPNEEKANALMRQGNSAVNTGINIWQAKQICEIFDSKNKDFVGLGTDDLMEELKDILRVSVGFFEWHDCGTLKSLYEISEKTPNHKNASLGGGSFERNDCRGCLLYAPKGMELRVSGAADTAIVFTSINEHPVLVIAKLSDSQKIKLLAEDFITHERILSDDFSMGSRNNIVLKSNVSSEAVIGFVGVDNYAVYIHRRPDGMLEAVVSQQLSRET